MRLLPIIGLALMLAACTPTPFSIDDAAFDQERMAHSASIGTMYLSTYTDNGDHNCDDSPSTCCASGYHMCGLAEVNSGGREIEDTGTGRDSTIYAVTGWVDTFADSSSIDCTGWTISTFTATTSTCAIATTMACGGSTACSASPQIWCCSS